MQHLNAANSRQPQPDLHMCREQTHGGFMDTTTTAEAIVASLVAHGIKTLYALPGVHNDHLFDALYKASTKSA